MEDLCFNNDVEPTVEDLAVSNDVEPPTPTHASDAEAASTAEDVPTADAALGSTTAADLATAAEPSKAASATAAEPTAEVVPAAMDAATNAAGVTVPADASNGEEPPNDRPPIPRALAKDDRFRLDERLGSGAFGEVWRGTDTRSSRQIAAKLEVKIENIRGLLVEEYECLHTLKDPAQQQGFAEVLFFGRQDGYVFMVMELLGASLADCIEVCKGSFTVRTVVLIAEQVLRRIEYLHSKALVHRDIKPENFMMGLGPRAHVVYLVDFGLIGLYYSDEEHSQLYKDTLTGTAHWCSVAAHVGAQSRRDDLESMGYMMIFFVKGALPWIGLEAKDADEEEEKIKGMKTKMNVRTLCNGLAPEFLEYMTYVRKLSFTERPDYGKLRGIFDKLRKTLGSTKDHELDWLEEGKPLALTVPPASLVPIEPWHGVKQPDDGVKKVWSCCPRKLKPRSRASTLRTQPTYPTFDAENQA
jgi:serine/threonine protein kinase